jgi:hypothetical protein
MTVPHPNGPRILVCGGRDYGDTKAINRTLAEIEPKCVIHGGARGADMLAGSWARRQGIPVIEVAAQWERYGKKAGYLRNRWMLELCAPDLVVAFPGGKGTRMMVDLAAEAGFAVRIPVEFGDGFTASVGRNPEGGDRNGLRAEHEHAVPPEEAADALTPSNPSQSPSSHNERARHGR